ncbi:protein O-mannosyl-transferase TMTC3 [Trichonephila inaurata madagascariensis]|uniref:Protein O-mannosyl-transferase TMTC3 n=1 Tax=Trichonephila inaurata madagascariensis TaxID=2747483 RepID=A0A8X6WSG4_9ARAC|nr:protein O-mannosyl-transferase TMTC3 [Trichonephila inaurata madagascariensis]
MEQSHKSYRPVCVFTYRLNYLLHGLQPFGYHLANVVLHALVCMLYKKTCSLFVSEGTAFLAALLFAIHPLHTEADQLPDYNETAECALSPSLDHFDMGHHSA